MAACGEPAHHATRTRIPSPSSTSPEEATTSSSGTLFAGVPLDVPMAPPGSLPVVACPTGRAITHSSPTTTVPHTRPTSLPAGLAAKLSYYSDDVRSLPPVLGPSGWHCWVQTGADGSGTIAIFWAIPPSDPTFRAEPGTYQGKSVQAVVATWTPACQGCVFDQVCAVVPAAVSQLGEGMPACKSKPPQEQVSWLRGSPTATTPPTDDAVSFLDPPGISGTGVPSGGLLPANGVMLYRFDSRGGRSSTETCTSVATLDSPCNAILNDFVVRNWGLW